MVLEPLDLLKLGDGQVIQPGSTEPRDAKMSNISCGYGRAAHLEGMLGTRELRHQQKKLVSGACLLRILGGGDLRRIAAPSMAPISQSHTSPKRRAPTTPNTTAWCPETPAEVTPPKPGTG